MSRNVQMVLLCEDRQHEAFARRFLRKAGWSTRRLRIEIAPRGRGSAEQFVRERFPTELSGYRSNRHRVTQGLIVVLDGDDKGVDARLGELSKACRAQKLEPRKYDDRVAILIPTRHIETWFAYLDGQTVDEREKYPRLELERDCQRHVDALYGMCQRGALRSPSPPSLDSACEEYQSRLRT